MASCALHTATILHIFIFYFFVSRQQRHTAGWRGKKKVWARQLYRYLSYIFIFYYYYKSLLLYVVIILLLYLFIFIDQVAFLFLFLFLQLRHAVGWRKRKGWAARFSFADEAPPVGVDGEGGGVGAGGLPVAAQQPMEVLCVLRPRPLLPVGKAPLPLPLPPHESLKPETGINSFGGGSRVGGSGDQASF